MSQQQKLDLINAVIGEVECQQIGILRTLLNRITHLRKRGLIK